MSKKTLEELITVTNNKFLFSNAVAGRAKQLAEGSLPYIETEDTAHPIALALQEFAMEKVRVKLLEGPRPKVERLVFEELPSGPSLEREKKKKKKA